MILMIITQVCPKTTLQTLFVGGTSFITATGLHTFSEPLSDSSSLFLQYSYWWWRHNLPDKCADCQQCFALFGHQFKQNFDRSWTDRQWRAEWVGLSWNWQSLMWQDLYRKHLCFKSHTRFTSISEVMRYWTKSRLLIRQKSPVKGFFKHWHWACWRRSVSNVLIDVAVIIETLN